MMKRKLGIFLLIASLMATFSISARELTEKEKDIIAGDVKSQMKDPESARFNWQDYRGSVTYCFHVNGKNSYGGYTGDTPVVAVVLQDEKGALFSAATTIYSGDNRSIGKDICAAFGYKV